MLASITPLGERGRQGYWHVTVVAFGLGASGAGALAGGLAGGIGAIVIPGSLDARARLLLLAGGAVAAIVLDAGGSRVPGPRRQVDERWLDQFRGWVYGLGYGAQLGFGVTTVVASAATYLAIVAALLLADVGRGALVMGCYGAIRGLSLLVGAGVRDPQELVRLHTRLERGRTVARSGGVLLMAAIVAGGSAGVLF